MRLIFAQFPSEIGRADIKVRDLDEVDLALQGAALGSAIPGLGTIIGGAVGAVVGFVGGLFGDKERKARSIVRDICEGILQSIEPEAVDRDQGYPFINRQFPVQTMRDIVDEVYRSLVQEDAEGHIKDAFRTMRFEAGILPDHDVAFTFIETANTRPDGLQGNSKRTAATLVTLGIAGLFGS